MGECSLCLTPSPTWASFISVIFFILIDVRGNLEVVLIYISLITKDGEHFLLNISLNISPIWEFPLLRILFRPIFKLCFLCTVFLVHCTFLDITLLSEVVLIKTFSSYIGSYVVWIMLFFAIKKPFHFMMSYMLTVDLEAYAYGFLFRKTFLVPLSSRLFPSFSSIRVSVVGLLLKSLIYVELTFM